MASVKQVIGKINPWLYASNGKELLKKYGSIDNIPADEVRPKSNSDFTLVYDSPTETLEPLYFFILDLMNQFGLNAEKLVDNFSSTPGSGHFGELGQRATIMQQNATRILGDVNNVLRSVLNITYDLKDFKTRLQMYDDLKDDKKKEAAKLSLKQIWMDRVDINKGNSSIKAMALGQGGFQTLLDAFLVAKDEKDVDKIDLNDRVKRILKPRIQEFNVWLKESEKELRKRFDLEKSYLRSQVNALKLYSRWAKPYLRAATELEMGSSSREPSLVKVFNSLLLELTLFGKSKLDVVKESFAGSLPDEFRKMKMRRDYFSCVLVDFRFRGIPQRAGQQQHYVFGGRAEVTFSSYALNSDELKKLDEELEKSDINDVLKLVEGTTSESLEVMQKDIESFLEDTDKGEKKSGDSANPFLALFGVYSEKKDEKNESKKSLSGKRGKLKRDDWIEKTHLRKLASENSKDTAFNLFDIYKKAHGMPSYA